MPTALSVAVINSNLDTCAMLEEYFAAQGWKTAAFSAKDVREDRITAATVMALGADVIVFDVAIPYEENYEAARLLRSDPQVRCPMVITTTNEAALRRLVGATGAVEIVGKPYDLAALRQAILTALSPGDVTYPEPSAHERRVEDRRVRDRRQSSVDDPTESSDDRSSDPDSIH